MAFQESSLQLLKHDEHLKSSSGIQSILEPFNKLTFDCKSRIKNVPMKSSEIESDESLGILPDLLNDDMTVDLYKTGLGLSDKEIDVFSPETDENVAAPVLSPPSDSQFNRISLFLKNISTPLPNFGSDRRFSSTPKVLASPLVANTTNIIQHNSPHFLLDEKEEEPIIIAGSCQIKYETDFNLDDLKNMKPLTSTYKALVFPQVPHDLNELNEEKYLKSEGNCEEIEEVKNIEKCLNVTQTLSNSEDLFPCDHGDTIQNGKILNDTFKIGPALIESDDAGVLLKPIPFTRRISGMRTNDNSKTEKVNLLDSTFIMPRNQMNCIVDCEKTFIFENNPLIGSEVSPKSTYKEGILNETRVLESASGEFSLKQQLQIANVTLTKELGNDAEILENRCHNSFGTTCNLTQILEETFSVNDLNAMSTSNKGESASPETFKTDAIYSEKCDESLPKKQVPQNDFLIEFSSLSSPTTPCTFHKVTEEKFNFCDAIQLAENVNGLANKINTDELQSIKNASTENMFARVEKKIEFCQNCPIEKDALLELASAQVHANAASNKERKGHFDPLQSVSDAIFSEKNNEISDQEVNKFFRRDSIQDENPSQLVPFITSNVSTSCFFPDDSRMFVSSDPGVFDDSNDCIGKSNVSLQPIFSRKPANSLDLSQLENFHCGTNLSGEIEESNFVANTADVIEICTQSLSSEDCSLEIVSKSENKCVNTTFLGKTCRLGSDTNSILTENKIRTSENSLNTMPNDTFTKKIDEDKNDQSFIPSEKDECQSSPNSPKEIIDATFLKSPDNGIKICDKINLNLKDSLSEKATDKPNSSLKTCLLESKSTTKRGLSKPTRIAYPRIVSEERVGQLPIAKSVCKSIVDKRPNTADFGRRSSLCNDSVDKSFSKDLNRRFSLSCSSKSSVDTSKYKNDFKKPFEIPSKQGINKPASNFQKSRIDTKYSNGHLKNNSAINDKKNLSNSDLISNKNIKRKSVASVYGKGQPISSRASHLEKLPSKSFKAKECGLRISADVVDAADKNTNKVTTCQKITDASRKEKLIEIGRNANLGKYSRHPIATNLPKKFPTSLSNIPNKPGNSKPPLINQKSLPSSSKLDSGKVSDNENRPKFMAKPGFSSLPKVQLHLKISSDSSKSGSVVEKRITSGNQKANGFLKKPCVSEGIAKQLVQSQISTRNMLPKKIRENTELNSSMAPVSSERDAQLTDPLDKKISNNKYGFLRVPNKIKDVKSINSNDIHRSQESEHQNQVCRQASGKLTQLRRIPIPQYKK